MEPDDGPDDGLDDAADGLEEEGPLFSWLPPDDRLWRHPSEVQGVPPEPGPELPGAPLPRPESRGRQSGTLVSALRPASRTWTVAMVAGLIGALAASGIGMVIGAFARDTTVVSDFFPNAPVVSLAPAAGDPVDWSTVDNEVAPSVVTIVATGASGSNVGSGFMFVDAPTEHVAYIITAGSVLSGGGQIQVTFPTGQSASARVIGNDPITGLALIAVPINKNLVFPNLGSVADLQLADPVLVVGARAVAGPSVFPGSVSADDDEVDLAGGTAMQQLIAVSSTPAVPDSTSGGPVVDQQGQVVGITVTVNATDQTDQQLTFAVPVDIAESFAQQMLKHEQASHPWIGVTDAVDVSPAVARELGTSGGAEVGAVWPGSPAAHLGIAANDVITAFNGQQVRSSGVLTELLAATTPKQPVVISYLHAGKTETRMILVGQQPAALNP